MKIVASLVLASVVSSAAHAAAQYGSNSPAQPSTPGAGGAGQAVQRLDIDRLTLLAGPEITSTHPGVLQSSPIPAINSTNPPAFLHKYRDPVFEIIATDANVKRTILRVTPPEAAKEFAAPAAATSTSLQFDQRLPAPPSAQTPRGQTVPGAIPLTTTP